MHLFLLVKDKPILMQRGVNKMACRICDCEGYNSSCSCLCHEHDKDSLSEMTVINDTKRGKCEVCGKVALLDKGYGTQWACESCYYEIGNHKKGGK